VPHDSIVPGFHNAPAAPDAQEHSWKTNPICSGIGDQPTGTGPPIPFPLERQGPANCAKRTQFAPAGSDPGGPIVRNEPNLHGGAGRVGARDAGRGFFPRPSPLRPSPGRLCETNPTCPEIGFRGSAINYLAPDSHPVPPGAPGAGQLCETNPICAGRPGPWGPIMQNEPNLPRVQMDANALQSKGLGRFWAEGRSCETNPICPGIWFRGSGISPLTPDHHPLARWSARGRPIVQNEPNLRRPARTPGANCAKRTQFAEGPDGC
jgi:hypothetical protein